MKHILLILGLFIFRLTVMSQGIEKVIITNSYEDLSNKIEAIEDKESVVKLYILVKENIKDWRLTPSFNAQFDYDNQPHNFNSPISELPKSIEEFVNLIYLDVSDLGLTGLGTSIPEFKKLEILNIAYNDIRIEEELEKLSYLTNLTTVIAFGCDISGYSVSRLRDLSSET